MASSNTSHPSAKALMRKADSVQANMEKLQQQVANLQAVMKQNIAEEKLLSALNEVRDLLLERMPRDATDVRRNRSDYIQ